MIRESEVCFDEHAVLFIQTFIHFKPRRMNSSVSSVCTLLLARLNKIQMKYYKDVKFGALFLIGLIFVFKHYLLFVHEIHSEFGVLSDS